MHFSRVVNSRVVKDGGRRARGDLVDPYVHISRGVPERQDLETLNAAGRPPAAAAAAAAASGGGQPRLGRVRILLPR